MALRGRRRPPPRPTRPRHARPEPLEQRPAPRSGRIRRTVLDYLRLGLVWVFIPLIVVGLVAAFARGLF